MKGSEDLDMVFSDNRYFHTVLQVLNTILSVDDSDMFCKAKLILEANPNFPNISSLRQTLNQLMIENTVVSFKNFVQNRQNLAESSCFFVVKRMKALQPYLLHVRNFKDYQFDIVDIKQKKSATINYCDVDMSYVPYVLLFDSDVKSDRLEYLTGDVLCKIKTVNRHLVWVVVLLIFSRVLYINFFHGQSLFSIVSLVVSMLGLCLSIVLTFKSRGLTYDSVDAFCSIKDIGNITIDSCSRVLSSASAKILDNISYSDVGSVYFLWGALSLILFYDETHLVIFLINMVAFVIVPYLLYQQIFRLKNICKLCILVHCVMLINLILAVIVFDVQSIKLAINIESVLIAAAMLLCAVSLYMYFIPLYISMNERLLALRDVRLFKYNKKNFEAIHNSRNLVEIPSCAKLIAGDGTSSYRILIVANPLCKSCIDHHYEVSNNLHGRFDVDVYYIFMTIATDDEQTLYAVLKLLEWSHATLTNNEYFAKAGDMFMDILEGECIDKLRKTYGCEDKSFLCELQEHRDWAIKNKIIKTPSVFVNGVCLNNGYKLKDLKWIFT